MIMVLLCVEHSIKILIISIISAIDDNCRYSSLPAPVTIANYHPFRSLWISFKFLLNALHNDTITITVRITICYKFKVEFLSIEILFSYLQRTIVQMAKITVPLYRVFNKYFNDIYS